MIALAIITFYFIVDPAKSTFSLPCIFYQLTGKYCMGCGGQRAFHALLHGEFTTVFRDNLLIIMVLPIISIKFLEEISGEKLLPQFIYSRKFLMFLAVFTISFMVLRNLAFEPFTLLVPEK